MNSEANNYTTSGIYLPLAILELQLALDIDRMTTQVMLTRLYVRMHINYREVSEMLRDFDEDEGRVVRVLAGNDRVSARMNKLVVTGVILFYFYGIPSVSLPSVRGQAERRARGAFGGKGQTSQRLVGSSSRRRIQERPGNVRRGHGYETQTLSLSLCKFLNV